MSGGTTVRAVGAETVKLRTLPAAAWTLVLTVAGAGLLAAAFAAAPEAGSSADIAVRTVRFVQVGILVMGIWPVAHEYAGRQRCTTLLAVPRRGILVVAKMIAAAAASSLLAVLSLGTAFIVAVLAGAPSRVTAEEARSLAGAALYLALIGLLGHGLALVTRSLMPALVAGLLLVLILPPLLEQATAQARWLPSAGVLLFESSDPLLGPFGGGAVLIGWAAVVTAVGAALTVHRDA